MDAAAPPSPAPGPAPSTPPLFSVPQEVDCSDVASMEAIGTLRYRVWEEEGSINPAAFGGSKSWLDPLDYEVGVARHFVVRDGEGSVVAAGRLSFHPALDPGNRDLALWQRCGKHIPLPTVDLGRLVVLKQCRGRGVAQALNVARVEAAKAMGAASIIATASDGNARLLRKLGFVDIGETITFDDRPGVVFLALQLDL